MAGANNAKKTQGIIDETVYSRAAIATMRRFTVKYNGGEYFLRNKE